jgi:hypothetical protein
LKYEVDQMEDSVLMEPFRIQDKADTSINTSLLFESGRNIIPD